MIGLKWIQAALCWSLVLAVAAATAHGQKRSPQAQDPCFQAKRDFIAAEQEWSSTNAEVSKLRAEMERLRDLRWEVKATLSVLADTQGILKEQGSLTEAQRITLNARIPNARGAVHPDGTFALAVFGNTPLKIEDAIQRLEGLLAQAERDVQGVESRLREKEDRTHQLSRTLNDLEARAERDCRAAGSPSPWEQGGPRVAHRDLHDRYAEKERGRQEEVEGRRQSDALRSWSGGYGYPADPYAAPPWGGGPGPYGALGVPPRGLLIELTNTAGTHSCRRCYPFRSPWEERWILSELERAAHNHERIPCAGRLGSFRVLDMVHDINECYRRAR
jgi:hypothetical protein